MLKMPKALDTSKTYYFRRVGPSTPRLECGEIYSVRYSERNKGWRVGIPKLRTSNGVALTVLANTDYWEYKGTAREMCNLDTTEEKTMAQEFASNNLEVKQGLLINGNNAEGFSEEQIIKLIAGQRKRKQELVDALGMSKYFQAQDKRITENIVLLQNVLDQRVENDD